jgi:hypothetical protein
MIYVFPNTPWSHTQRLMDEHDLSFRYEGDKLTLIPSPKVCYEAPPRVTCPCRNRRMGWSDGGIYRLMEAIRRMT